MSEFISFFWIAFYNDGTILSQFDLDTGQEHLFKEIDQTKLEKFGWFPITDELAKKISDPRFRAASNLPYFLLRLRKGQRLIALRREYQRFFSYSFCTKCGFTWQWMPGQPDNSIGDAGLPRFGEAYAYSEEVNGKKIFELVCPRCGEKNYLKCPECNEWWNKINNEGLLQCPKCKKTYTKMIKNSSDSKIENIFLLGWQETTPDGRNRKMIMFINQDGTFEISDDFNFK